MSTWSQKAFSSRPYIWAPGVMSRDFRPDAAATVALDSCRLVSMDISDRATWRKRRVQLKR